MTYENVGDLGKAVALSNEAAPDPALDAVAAEGEEALEIDPEAMFLATASPAMAEAFKQLDPDVRARLLALDEAAMDALTTKATSGAELSPEEQQLADALLQLSFAQFESQLTYQGGDVTIGTDAARKKLDVSGSATVDQGLSVGGAASIAGKVTVGTADSTSALDVSGDAKVGKGLSVGAGASVGGGRRRGRGGSGRGRGGGGPSSAPRAGTGTRRSRASGGPRCA